MLNLVRKTGSLVKKNFIPITGFIVGVGVVVIYMSYRQTELLKDITLNRFFEEELLINFLDKYDLNELWDGHAVR